MHCLRVHVARLYRRVNYYLKVIAVIISNHRSKIPKQYGFILKTNQLEGLMADIDIPVHLFYSGTWSTRYSATEEIFHARYCFPDSFYDYAHLHISAGFLLKEDVSLAREELSEVALPEFVVWVKNILALPDDSTYFYGTPFFIAVFRDKQLTITKS